jgi:hypothetical protein
MKKLEEKGYAIITRLGVRCKPYFVIDPVNNFGLAKLVFENKAYAIAFNKSHNNVGKVVKVKVIEQ